MSGHTKGPWQISSGWIWGEGKEVAKVSYMDRNAASKEGRRALANAHLIAAAPKLLEALENLITFLHHVGFSPADAIDEELQEAETAIAKAKGQPK